MSTSLFWFATLGILFAAPNAEPATLIFYVAPNGNDAHSGKLSERNRTRTDGPFRSISRDNRQSASFADRETCLGP